ncbi:hypothetical protein QQZ08_001470 [Neonectria magnoliae]|uniref:Uncharacterized protein n=1 Tax=Neonectria magnoliae TaxID=2732573 RepID=A0ABR1IGE8_9HYPO
MALIPFVLLALASSAQATPLWGLLRRQEALCGNPDVATAASLVVPGAQGDVTFTPSQVADTALWTLPTPTTLSETETVYPFGYVWVPSEPVTLEVPALPTADVPYPLPEGASATLCNAQIPANTSVPTTTDIVENLSTPTSTSVAREETSTTVPPVISTTFTDPIEQPSTPVTPTTLETTTTVPPVISTTFTDVVEDPTTPTTLTTAEDTTTAVPPVVSTTFTDITSDPATPTTPTTAPGTTTSETSSDETSTTETTAETTTAETTADTTTTAEDTTTAADDTTTAEQPDGTTSFPEFDPPTTTVSGPEATDDAIDAGPILFALWFNRDNLQDEEKKEEYIKKTEETRDDILVLWNNFDIKPEIPTPCGQLSLKKRSLISGVLDVLDDAAKLIGCATEVITNLVDNVKLPEPPIDIIVTLTDTLKDISEKLEEEEKEQETDKPTTTDEISTTEEPTTTTTSCAETGVESCTQTVHLSTSFYKDGDTDTSTVKTVTTEDCVTVTQCDAEATTEVTTVTTVTSSASYEVICDVDCTKCNPERRWAQPTFTPEERRARRDIVKRLDDMNQAKYDTDEKKDVYIRRQIGEISKNLNWNTITTNVVSIDAAWEDFPIGLSVEGLVGCTGVTIASDKGGWLAHFMEPGFFYDQNLPEDDAANNGRKQLWDGMMNQLRGAEGTTISDRFKPPATLAGAGGILASDTNVQIFVSAPRIPDTTFEEPTLRYPDRVAELIDILTNENGPFPGVEVITKTYVKPPAEETDDEIDARLKTARGIMFIEYDDFQQNWATGEYDEGTSMWRVWQERSYYERMMTSAEEASPTCARHEDEAAGMDPSTANALAKKFCEDSNVNFDEDAELQLGGGDLDPTQELAADIKFSFEKKDGECSMTCTEIYEKMVSTCQYNSHLYTGKSEFDLGCGKYTMDTIKIEEEEEPEPEPTAPAEVNNCADSTVYTKFSLSQAEDAISDFCSHEIVLPKAAQPVFKTYKMDGVTLQLITQWSTTGQKGCNESPDGGYHPEMSQSDCEARFTGAVNNCNTDSTDDKYGQRPYVWNSPNGCIDFWIYGDGEDFDCEGLGTIPVPCMDAGQKLD